MAHRPESLAATVLTVLAVFTFLATHEGWNVWLIGGSHRWAAGAILVLGMGTCSLGSPDRSTRGQAARDARRARARARRARARDGSLIPLALLVVDFVLLWAVSTFRHGRHAPQAPAAR